VLRHFAAGRLTNDEYEDASHPWKASPDRAVRAIWWEMWQTYDDLHPHRLTGQYALRRDGRRTVARMVLFLHADVPYEWPSASRTLRMLLLKILTFGVWGRGETRTGDSEVWPFFKADDLCRAVAKPQLLAGRRD
jgi:hypothetical protein